MGVITSSRNTSGSGRFHTRSSEMREAVDAHVVVLVVRARRLQRARLARALAEFLHAEEGVRLAEERAFPLAGLRGMVAPRDGLVLRRVVAAVLDLISNAGVDVLDQAAVQRQAEQRRQHALGGAVERLSGGGVAELGDDGAAAEDEAVGAAAAGRERPERLAEDALLVRVVARALGLVRARELDGRLELRRVEAGRGRVAPRPGGVTRGRDVVGGELGEAAAVVRARRRRARRRGKRRTSGTLGRRMPGILSRERHLLRPS